MNSSSSSSFGHEFSPAPAEIQTSVHKQKKQCITKKEKNLGHDISPAPAVIQDSVHEEDWARPVRAEKKEKVRACTKSMGTARWRSKKKSL